MNAKPAALATAVALLGASLGVTLTPASAAHDDASPKTMYTRHVKGSGKLQTEFSYQKNSRGPESPSEKGGKGHEMRRRNKHGGHSSTMQKTISWGVRNPGPMGHEKIRGHHNKPK